MKQSIHILYCKVVFSFTDSELESAYDYDQLEASLRTNTLVP
jgi:hypothetical protein